MNFRDRWPLRRRPDPPVFVPVDPAAVDPVGWQRHTPIQPWMTIPTDPRMPAPAAADTTEETPMTEPDTEQLEIPEPPAHPRCPSCGRPVPTVSDHLRESVDVVAPRRDELAIAFYRRLFQMAPHTEILFPPDILTGAPDDEDSAGAAQRERIVKAVIAVSKYYDPSSSESMEALNNTCDIFGVEHSNFGRPDGTNRGATFGEYRVVGVALADAFHEIAGDEWRPEFDAAWAEAYDHIADRMIKAQKADDQTRYGRQPRTSTEPIVAHRRAEHL